MKLIFGARMAAFFLGAILAVASEPIGAQQLNNALHLSGSGQWVSVPPAADLMNADLITVECWVRPGSNTLRRIASKGDGLNAFSDRSWVLSSGNQQFQWDVFLSAPNGATRWLSMATPASYPSGVFHHLAATYSSHFGRARLYVDGNLVAESTLASDGYSVVSSTVRQSTQAVRIGWEPPLASMQFIGDIDALRIWTVERSQADIQDSMAFELSGFRSGLAASFNANGDAHDATGNGHDGSLQGAVSFSPATWDYAPVFGNPAIFVETGNPLPFQPWEATIEAWVKPQASQQGRIVSIGDPTGGPSTLDLTWSNQQFTVAFSAGSPSSTATVVSPPTSAAGVWHHVAATFSGFDGQACLYVDGSLAGLTTSLGAGAPGSLAGSFLNPSGSSIRVGSTSSSQSLAFNGQIDEVRLWQYARSAGAIRTAMDRMIDHQPGLMLSLHLNGDVTDASGTTNPYGPALSYSQSQRVPSFHLVSAVRTGAAFDFALIGVPSGATSGFTVASFDTSGPAGGGPVFGITPDSLTFAMIGFTPNATPGDPFHFAYPVAAALSPNAPFAVPAGVLAAGLTIDLIAVALDGGGVPTPTPPIRITLD